MAMRPRWFTTHRRITLAVSTRCSQSRPALGSSRRYTLAFCARHMAMATRCSSPPDRSRTFSSHSAGMCKGFITISLNSLSEQLELAKRSKRSCVVPGNFLSLGAYTWGLYDTPRSLKDPSTEAREPSAFLGSNLPLSSSMKVVLPHPFWPSSPTQSLPEKEPASTCRVNSLPLPLPRVLLMFG
mmetsp:Transcript_36765/g.79587  ORF Transcript_36765/g.79587 Transcript_36765/m.79587 type:complete len:184 (+) Transcript_36765:405-956(+)